MVAFTPAAASPVPGGALSAGESWWLSPSLNSVLALRPCPQTGLCARVVWYSPGDRRLADTFQPRGWGQPAANMCNYALTARFNRVNDQRYDGQLRIDARNINVNLRIDELDQNSIRMHARAGLLFRNEVLRRVPVGDSRYAHCRPN